MSTSPKNLSASIFDLSSGPNCDVYGVDMSQFAGMQEDLRFTVGGPLSFCTIDDMVFSTSAVPQPTTPGLLVVGGLVSWILRRKQ